MKAYIRQRKHIVTGHLLNSIKFKSSYRNDELLIKFNSKFYIDFLDSGKFVDDFFKLESTNDIIQEFVFERVEQDIDEIILS